MNAPSQIVTPEGRPFDWAAFHGFTPAPGTTRYHGWTPDKQRSFLEALAEGHSVKHACLIVGLSKQSAYALRNSAKGTAFALGWQAALLRGRDVLADDLMDRALHGYTETITRDDGSIVTRHRHDNRLGMAMLTRLDRAADAARAAASDTAARLIAQEFEQYCELIGKDAGPARAGLFLAARLDAEPAGETDLAPVRALARADRWLRTRTDIADAPDTSDLDPAQRATWTAEQWLRAESAGLVALAPEPAPEPEPELESADRDGMSQASQAHEPGPVWWDGEARDFRTDFPPPEGFFGWEEGEYGDHGYERELSDEERAVIEAERDAEIEERREAETLDRDRWFGFVIDAEVEARSEAATTANPPPEKAAEEEDREAVEE